MVTLREILARLASDRTALMRFLAEPQKWIGAWSDGLEAAEAMELRRLARDAAGFLEGRVREAMCEPGEARFAAAARMERRRFAVIATSMVMCGVLGCEARSGKAEQGDEEGLKTDVAGDVICPDGGCAADNGCVNEICVDTRGPDACVDNECMNNTKCNDEMGCHDEGCHNNGICNDAGACVDSGCSVAH